MHKLILSITLCGGLFISGLAQVADNVDQAARYRVAQDNITAIAESHNLSSFEATQTDLRVLESRSNAQLEELGSRYGWIRSSSQLEDLGSRYGWIRSSSQLEDLGSRYGWIRSSSQLEDLGSRYGWIR